MATLVVLILFLTHKLVSCWLSADGNEMTAKIDLAVAKLKKINLTNEEDLEILRCVNGNFSSENVNNLYSTMFAERGGIQVLNTWLNFFYSKSHTDHNTALFKPYCGVILSILVWGTHFFPFSQKIVQSGLLRLLIRFMMQDKLFGDDDFTDDFLFTSSTAVENLEHFESLLPEVQYVIQKAIHQQSAQVHHRFCSEQNKIVKLRLAFLLGSQNLSTMSDEDLESTFSLSPIELLGVREKLKTILISENNTIIYQPRTSYIPYYSWVPYWKLLRMFNVLLLSKSNRLTLCKDKQTVEYYFYGVKNLTKQNSNFIELASLYTVALRGLYILSLSCPNYQEHMDEAELSDLDMILSNKQLRAFNKLIVATKLLKNQTKGSRQICYQNRMKFEIDHLGIKGRCNDQRRMIPRLDYCLVGTVVFTATSVVVCISVSLFICLKEIQRKKNNNNCIPLLDNFGFNE